MVVQMATFNADASLRMANVYKAEEKIGNQLARLNQAAQMLLDAKRAHPKPCPAMEVRTTQK